MVAGRDFGKALGMLLRPQLQQLPLAVIDEVIVRAGTISTLVRLFWRIGCAGDGEITRISFLNAVFASGGAGWLGAGGIVSGCVSGWGNCGA